MATPAKAVLQPDPLPALTNDVNQLDERLNAKEQAHAARVTSLGACHVDH